MFDFHPNGVPLPNAAATSFESEVWGLGGKDSTLNPTWRFMGLRKYSYNYLNWGYT